MKVLIYVTSKALFIRHLFCWSQVLHFDIVLSDRKNTHELWRNVPASRSLFFLHRHSQLRADMPVYPLCILSIRQSIALTLTHAHAWSVVCRAIYRACKARTCSLDAGASGKTKIQKNFFSVFTQTPHVPGADLRNFGAPVLALRKRPAGRMRMSEAAGRVCAVERTWP